MSRSTGFDGTSGAPWPTLSNGDAWGAGFWASPAPLASEVDPAPTATISGGVGSISAVINKKAFVQKNVYTQWNSDFALIPGAALPTASTTVFTTNPTTATIVDGVTEQYYFTPQNAPPDSSYQFAPSKSGVNLIFIQTASTGQTHKNYIDTTRCTGEWQNQAYELVGRYDWQASISGTTYYFHISAWKMTHSSFPSVDSGVRTTGKIAFYLRNSAGTTPVSGGGYHCFPHVVSNINNASSLASLFRSSGGSYLQTASGSTGQPTITMSPGLANGSVFIAFATHAQANTSSNAQTLWSYSYTIPNVGAAILVDRTSNRVLAANFQTSGTPSATSAWAAVGIEIPDNTLSSSVVPDNAAYTYLRLVDNATPRALSTDTYVTMATSASGVAPWSAVVVRYFVDPVTGYRHWLEAWIRPRTDPTKGFVYLPVITHAVDNGTSVTRTDILESGLTLRRPATWSCAVRISPYLNGTTWICAKFWDATEPSWLATGSATATGELSGSADSAVICTTMSADSVFSTMGNGGKSGVAYIYSSQLGTEGTLTLGWDSYSDDLFAYTASGLMSAVGGDLAASDVAERVAVGSGFSGVGDMSAVYARRRQAEGSLDGAISDLVGETEVRYGNSQVGPYLGAVVTR